MDILVAIGGPDSGQKVCSGGGGSGGDGICRDGCNTGSGGRGGGSAVGDGGSGCGSIDIDCGFGGSIGGINSSGRNSSSNGGRGAANVMLSVLA